MAMFPWGLVLASAHEPAHAVPDRSLLEPDRGLFEIERTWTGDELDHRESENTIPHGFRKERRDDRAL